MVGVWGRGGIFTVILNAVQSVGGNERITLNTQNTPIGTRPWPDWFFFICFPVNFVFAAFMNFILSAEVNCIPFNISTLFAL